MTSTDYYLFTGISARLILNAENRALTRTSIFFNTHNSTNQYFLTCNLILTVIQLLQTQQEWSSNISICYRKTLPLCRFGSASVLQRQIFLELHFESISRAENQRHQQWFSGNTVELDWGIFSFLYFCRAIITMHFLCFIYIVLFIKYLTTLQTDVWDHTTKTMGKQ